MACNPYDEKFTHHCELIPDEAHGRYTSFNKCKNPCHENFLTVAELKMKHLPPNCRTESYMDLIRSAIDKTLKITVSYTSTGRPDTYIGSNVPYPFCDYKGTYQGKRCGTGYIMGVIQTVSGKVCPCPLCKTSDDPKMEYWIVRVSTSTHVIFDTSEAENAVFELFYDSEDRDGVEYLYGYNTLQEDVIRCRTDFCDMECVTHDRELSYRLDDIISNTETRYIDDPENTAIIVSHPHGVCKRISFGKLHYLNIIQGVDIELKLKKGDRCHFLSCVDEQEQSQYCDSAYANPSSNFTLCDRQASSFSEFSETDNHEICASYQQKDSGIQSAYKLYDIISQSGSTNVYELPFDLNITIPSNSKYHFRGSLDDDSGYFCPTDSIFTSPEGKIVCVPMSTRFYSSQILTPSGKDAFSYITHNMPACPGSSGARILNFIFQHYDVAGYNHFGSREEYNITGLKSN